MGWRYAEYLHDGEIIRIRVPKYREPIRSQIARLDLQIYQAGVRYFCVRHDHNWQVYDRLFHPVTRCLSFADQDAARMWLALN